MAAACATIRSSSMRKRPMVSNANCQAGTLARLTTGGSGTKWTVWGMSSDCMGVYIQLGHGLCICLNSVTKRSMREWCNAQSRWRAAQQVSPPAPAPVKRMTGGMGKSWEPAPRRDYKFCQYVSPSVAHDSGPCDCMTSPSPFGPFYWRACDVYLRMHVLDAFTLFYMTRCKIRGWGHYDIILGSS